MKTKIYPWDTKEQQRAVKPYKFVDFQDNFLQIYQQKRQQNTFFLKKQIKNTKIDFNEFIKATYSIGDLKILHKFDTEKVIKTLYFLLNKERKFLNKRTLEHYRRILKKEELKKLKKSYNSNFINTSKENIGLESYGYFALTLGTYALKPDIQSLSTLLKVNDFLISEKENLTNSLEQNLLLNSLQLEKQQIEKIMKEKQVK